MDTGLVKTLTALPLDWAMLPALLVIGGIASYHDVRTRTIPNRLIRAGLAVGVLWLVALALAKRLGWWLVIPAAAPYPEVLLVNGALSWLVGYALWRFDLWSAGDGKLFAVLGMLVTPGLTGAGYARWFPASTLLVNSFACVLAVIVVELAVKMAAAAFRQAKQREKLGQVWAFLKANRGEYFSLAATFLVTLLLTREARGVAREWIGLVVRLDPATIYLMLFLLFHPLHELSRKPWFRPIIVGGFALWLGVAIWKVSGGLATPAMIIRSAFMMSGVMFFILGFSVVYHVASPLFFQDRLSARYLRPGMMLGNLTIRKMEQDPVFIEHYAAQVGPLNHQPLSEQAVEEIREWYAHQEDRTLFFVERHIPFAPGLFAGSLLTLVLRAPVISLVKG